MDGIRQAQFSLATHDPYDTATPTFWNTVLYIQERAQKSDAPSRFR
jgi:hypothetical protein